jgi:hypothetical protein
MIPDGSQMAKRKTKSRRRRFKGVNLVNAAEAIVSTGIITQGIFNVDPAAFFLGKDSTGYFRSDLAVSNDGGVRIGLGELLGTTGNAEGNWRVARQNLEKNWGKMLVQEVVTAAGFKLGRKLLAKQRRQMNAGIRMIGLGDTVKV